MKDNFFSRLLEAMDLVNNLSKKGNTDYWIFKHIQCVNLDLVEKKLLRSYYIARSCLTDVNTTNFIFQSRDWNLDECLPEGNNLIDNIDKRKGSCNVELKNYVCQECRGKLYYNGKMVNCRKCGYFKSFKNYMKDQLI
jgi:hypothetical protein